MFGGTIGQTVLLVTGALFIAQAIGFFLLVNERDRWQLLDAVQPAIEQFVTTARYVEHARAEQRVELAFHLSRPERRYMLADWNAIGGLGLARQGNLERKLVAAFTQAGVHVKGLQASSIGFSDSPPGNRRSGPMPMRAIFFATGGRTNFGFATGMMTNGVPPDRGPHPTVNGGPPDGGPQLTVGGVPPEGGTFTQMMRGPADGVPGPSVGGPPGLAPDGERHVTFGGVAGPPSFSPDRHINLQELDLSAQLPDGSWLNGQFVYFRPSTNFVSRLVLAELILLALVLAATIALAMRLARPLLRLATAADRIGPNQSPMPVPESGPGDVRAAIRSFNAMTARISDLLREKDRMLGAIGHDLRTPLASLRIRAESIEPASERHRMIEMIDDLTRTLGEILDLARLGRSTEGFAPVDLSALADAIVEEFREIGNDATFLDSPRAVVNVQPLLTKRLLRNLIENAIKFGERARAVVKTTETTVRLEVSDDGPGIPQDAFGHVLEPFARLEHSRSRATGGAGLGLSIAREIARIQHAELTLENGTQGGFVVSVVFPRILPPHAVAESASAIRSDRAAVS